jgi:hypothetical protein
MSNADRQIGTTNRVGQTQNEVLAARTQLHTDGLCLNLQWEPARQRNLRRINIPNNVDCEAGVSIREAGRELRRFVTNNNLRLIAEVAKLRRSMTDHRTERDLNRQKFRQMVQQMRSEFAARIHWRPGTCVFETHTSASVRNTVPSASPRHNKKSQKRKRLTVQAVKPAGGKHTDAGSRPLGCPSDQSGRGDGDAALAQQTHEDNQFAGTHPFLSTREGATARHRLQQLARDMRTVEAQCESSEEKREAFTQLILKVDAVNTGGSDELRSMRKSLVRACLDPGALPNMDHTPDNTPRVLANRPSHDPDIPNPGGLHKQRKFDSTLGKRSSA